MFFLKIFWNNEVVRNPSIIIIILKSSFCTNSWLTHKRKRCNDSLRNSFRSLYASLNANRISTDFSFFFFIFFIFFPLQIRSESSFTFIFLPSSFSPSKLKHENWNRIGEIHSILRICKKKVWRKNRLKIVDSNKLLSIIIIFNTQTYIFKFSNRWQLDWKIFVR